MKGQRFRRIIIWLGSALFLLACVSPLLALSSPTQAPHSLTPELLGPFIAQTAAAAQTQTMVYAPPSFTPTLTPPPTWTPFVLSSTPTFFFALPTFTPLPTWTSTPGAIILIPGGAGSAVSNPTATDSPFTGKEWTCGIRERVPPMNSIIKAGVSFNVSITLFNTGTKTWPNTGVDFVYTGGLRPEGTRIKDFSKTIAPGKEIVVNSNLIAPKISGVYNTYWALQVGRHPFCGVKYTFKVK